jgi:hypothetical protein
MILILVGAGALVGLAILAAWLYFLLSENHHDPKRPA